MSDWIEAAPGAFYNLDQIEALRKVGGNVRIAFVSGAIIVIGDPPEDCAEALVHAVEERAKALSAP